MVLLFLAACVTALATGLGALPVYALGDRAELLRPLLWASVAGIMTVASVQGLLLPGLREGDDLAVLAGLAAGVAFLTLARARLGHRDVQVGQLRGTGARRAALVFGVLFVHSLPEGLALGAAWASGTAGLGLFVFVAISLQNVPEGTATAIPLREAQIGLGKAFWIATLTSAPQPVGAIGAFMLVEAIHPLLPASFGFAAGAMLALVAVEVVPTVMRGPRRPAAVTTAVLAGGAMALLGVLLGTG